MYIGSTRDCKPTSGNEMNDLLQACAACPRTYICNDHKYNTKNTELTLMSK